MKHKINSLFEGWKEKGLKHPDNKKEIRSEAKKFVGKHNKDEIIQHLEKEYHHDVALGLEIKYLDWLRGIW